jgi:small subunit ribosomal protein S15
MIMALNAAEKLDLIKTYGKNEQDTGSSESQIAILTKNIGKLTGHLKINKKDLHSRRGLIHMVTSRRKLLDYLKGKSVARYAKIIDALGIRK